jgi:hypothetical protein
MKRRLATFLYTGFDFSMLTFYRPKRRTWIFIFYAADLLGIACNIVSKLRDEFEDTKSKAQGLAASCHLTQRRLQRDILMRSVRTSASQVQKNVSKKASLTCALIQRDGCKT